MACKVAVKIIRKMQKKQLAHAWYVNIQFTNITYFLVLWRKQLCKFKTFLNQKR